MSKLQSPTNRLGCSETECYSSPLRPLLSLGATSPDPRNPDRKRLPLLSSAQVAAWLGISQRTVCLWAELEEVPAFKLGHQWRFREDEVRRWLEGQSSIALGKRN
jgi:excisionase family DNA binding protein